MAVLEICLCADSATAETLYIFLGLCLHSCSTPGTSVSEEVHQQAKKYACHSRIIRQGSLNFSLRDQISACSQNVGVAQRGKRLPLVRSTRCLPGNR